MAYSCETAQHISKGALTGDGDAAPSGVVITASSTADRRLRARVVVDGVRKSESDDVSMW